MRENAVNETQRGPRVGAGQVDTTILIGDRDRSAGDHGRGVGDMIQVRLDVVSAIQPGQRHQTWIDGGQEPGEMSEPGRQARHRLGAAGAGLAVQIGDEQHSQFRADALEPVVERLWLLCWWRRLFDDTKMEQHGVSARERALVVMRRITGILRRCRSRGWRRSRRGVRCNGSTCIGRIQPVEATLVWSERR